EALRKEHKLSDYMYWQGHGGVEAMRAERDKGMEWKCGFCHFLEPTTTSANKYEDPATMPHGKRRGTKEEIAQYQRRLLALIVYPKQQYVDRIKRDVRKCCAFCARPVLDGEEHAFTFDHLDELTKMKNNPVTGEKTLAGKNGGVAGLVANHTKAATLDKIRDVLDAEMAKCQLLCHNCNHRKTYGYPL
ncbi:MAG: hypothetical protein CMI16_07630, partial [Opitutaceae bacterium]|nr:hypothetical protein [Opitutaceae bacterium]